MDMGNITKAVPIILPVEDWARLKKLARDERRSASAIVRQLVSAHLGRRPERTRKGVGA